MDQALTKINALAARHGIAAATLSDANMLAFVMAVYTEGSLDGALSAAQKFVAEQLVANSAPAQPQVSERRERLTADLEVGRREHPDLDFDKPVFIKRTAYKIVGYNRNAPKHAFIIEGPQGGRYKCPLSMIVAGHKTL
jgi:hypothetical protein